MLLYQILHNSTFLHCQQSNSKKTPKDAGVQSFPLITERTESVLPQEWFSIIEKVQKKASKFTLYSHGGKRLQLRMHCIHYTACSEICCTDFSSNVDYIEVFSPSPLLAEAVKWMLIDHRDVKMHTIFCILALISCRNHWLCLCFYVCLLPCIVYLWVPVYGSEEVYEGTDQGWVSVVSHTKKPHHWS